MFPFHKQMCYILNLFFCKDTNDRNFQYRSTCIKNIHTINDIKVTCTFKSTWNCITITLIGTRCTWKSRISCSLHIDATLILISSIYLVLVKCIFHENITWPYYTIQIFHNFNLEIRIWFCIWTANRALFYE